MTYEELIYGKGTVRTRQIPGKIGETQSSAGMDLMVTQVEIGKRATLGAQGRATKLVNVEITLRNVEREGFDYDSRYFKVVDRDALEFTRTFSAPSPALESGLLAKGEAVSGWVQFELPAGSKGLTFWYEIGAQYFGSRPFQIDLGL